MVFDGVCSPSVIAFVRFSFFLKPAGPGVRNCITDLLPRLEHRILKLEGKLCYEDEKGGGFSLPHRLDKDCTGVMLIAR